MLQLMKTQAKENQGVHILEISGEVDFHSSRELRDEFQQILDKKVPKKFMVNLKKVTYVDSSGLATFVEVLQKMRRIEGKLILVGLVPAVKGVFEIAKLDSLFALEESEERALEALAS